MRRPKDKVIAGIDLHGNNLVIGLMNQDGKRLSHQELDCDLKGVEEFLRPYKQQLQSMAVESTYNWYWLVDIGQDNITHRLLGTADAAQVGDVRLVVSGFNFPPVKPVLVGVFGIAEGIRGVGQACGGNLRRVPRTFKPRRRSKRHDPQDEGGVYREGDEG